MPPILRAIRFTPEMQPEVQSFDCGTSDEALDMADWIKGPRCVASMATRKTEVWLFRTEIGDLVGFGSIGKTNWPWPEPNSPLAEASIIPAIAVESRFKRQPPGLARNEQYSGRMILFLIARARTQGTPRLVLYVRPDNTSAISLYDFVGFKPLPDIQRGNMKMFLDLTQDA